MGIVVSGKDLAKSLKDQMAIEVIELEKKYGRLPHLAVILVGEDPGSVSYVKGKEKACLEIGIKNTTIKRDSNISEFELLTIIDELNNDETVDGILVQLPLPKHINTDKVISSVRFDKDVDGFHPMNVASLYLKQPGVVPCTPKGVIKLLKSINYPIQGKKAVVIGRSNIVGMPVSKLLLDENATVTVCHSHTKDLARFTKMADIIICAVGKPNFIDKHFIRADGTQIIIDVGINRVDGKLVGDVNKEVAPYVKYLTPVPGGVGLLTRAALMNNVVMAADVQRIR